MGGAADKDGESFRTAHSSTQQYHPSASLGTIRYYLTLYAEFTMA